MSNKTIYVVECIDPTTFEYQIAEYSKVKRVYEENTNGDLVAVKFKQEGSSLFLKINPHSTIRVKYYK